MNPFSMIPSPDPIPAPAWIFLLLDILMFAIHILVINAVLGGALIIIFKMNKSAQPKGATNDMADKIPTLFALGINFGVAPLLFMQVIYGHLFYSSSILMAVYWIMIIPVLIIAYYAAYVCAKKKDLWPVISKVALSISALILLYISFIFVNNMTLMLQPEKWEVYLQNPGGTFLNLAEPTLLPRYLHFIGASVAVGGLFAAYIQHRKAKTDSIWGLKIFGCATIFQAVVGMWFLASIPHEFLRNFMGRDSVFTAILFLGFLTAMASIAAAFANRLKATYFFFLLTLTAMILTRNNLRTMYLGGKFSIGQLRLMPQYGVMALFLMVLTAGTLAIIYMLKLSGKVKEGRVSQ